MDYGFVTEHMRRIWLSARILLLALFGLVGPVHGASTLEMIGVTALRAVTTNLSGSGIRVAQPEASLTLDNLTWEVNPPDVSQPAALFTYGSEAGSTNTFPNALGADSWHAKDVANNFYGLPSGVATNVAQVDNYEANYFITGVVQTLRPGIAILVNQSFVDSNTNAQSAYDTLYDNYAAQYKTLFVSGAGNGGPVLPPSTSYNGISVACYAPDAASSIGPTLDNGRCKPDLTAPASFTSFSTPLVSGAAAVLMQAALRGDGGGDTNAAFDLRTIKALLLNGAVKPADWTNSSASPLDARYGAGMVNLLNSYQQLAGGRRSNYVSTTVSLNGAHPPTGASNTIAVLSGWDYGTNTSSASQDAIRHYYFNVSNSVAGAKFAVTATLVWHRHQNKAAINNLNLFLYNCANSNLVTGSTSRVDNVEHIYQTNLVSGRYDLQVWKAGGNSGAIVTTSEAYALAFAFWPQPTLVLTTNLMLTWPVYPAGFGVEMTANLLASAWSATNFPPPVLTNSMNTLRLNATNASQFFRLQSPNF